MIENPLTESDTAKLRQRNRELFILSRIAEALNREVNLDRALQAALSQVAELFGLHTGWIFLLHEDTGDGYLAAAQELPPALLEHNCLLMEGNCSCLDSYHEGGLDNRNRVNVITCSRLKDLMAGTDGLRYHASIPLYAQQKRLGLLNVASAESHWWVLSSDELPLLHTVGDLVSIAIERGRLFARSTQLGMIEERNRLAREIHDTLAQGLTGISLKLESIDAMLEMGEDPRKIRQTVAQTLALTRANLEEARRSVLDLRAALLEGRSLVEALTELIASQQKKDELSISFTITGGSRPLPGRVEVGVYRIVQEGITNIIRHAQAKQVEINVAITPKQIRLTIEDDGRGFDPTQTPPGHYGLAGLNERVKLLGGNMKLETSPGQGVRLEVAVPLG